MDTGPKKKWLKALRSGEYTQGVGYLRTTDDTYCCLGVLCDLTDGEWAEDNDEAYIFQLEDYGELMLDLDPIYLDLFGLDDETQADLVDMNDSGSTFEEIADYIEEYL